MPTGPSRTSRTATKTAATAAKPRRRATPRQPTREQIAERAYYLSLEGGGDEVGNWLRAEQELMR